MPKTNTEAALQRLIGIGAMTGAIPPHVLQQLGVQVPEAPQDTSMLDGMTGVKQKAMLDEERAQRDFNREVQRAELDRARDREDKALEQNMKLQELLLQNQLQADAQRVSESDSESTGGGDSASSE